mmetsp:Transcript_27825/g.91057  ORF Transcript_27825/g.91057 Transcript_27825/m.91057 type:complete len:281 (-) Transcript_27825:1377-2219(-)
MVALRERPLRGVARLVARRVQNLVDAVLKALLHGAPGLRLELLLLRLLDQAPDILLRLCDDVVDGFHRRFVRDGVPDANREAVLEQPVVDERLGLGEEDASCGGAPLAPDDVDQRPPSRPERLFAQRPHQEPPVLDEHFGVARRKVGLVGILMPRRLAPNVDVGEDEVEHLLPCPERARLQDCWRRDFAVPILHPHQDVHKDVFFDERVALRDDAAPEQGVLHDVHDGLVRLRAHNHLWHHHQLLNLRLGLERLREVHVHLVAVEIGVVRRRDGEIEPKG